MPQEKREILQTKTWYLDHTGGVMRQLRIAFADGMHPIPLRQDEYAGVRLFGNGQPLDLITAWEEDRPVYRGTWSGTGCRLSLGYRINQHQQLVISVTLENDLSGPAELESLRVQLGFDTFLLQYPDYLDQLFPTLLRCERTHLWGYFSTPSGHLLAIHTLEPVSSYTQNYEKDAQGIFTASVDLLCPGPLPERHPHVSGRLEPGERRTWNLVLTPIPQVHGLEALKPHLAALSPLPVVHGDLYTIGEGEESRLTVFSAAPLKGSCLTVTDPQGVVRRLPVTDRGGNRYTAVFSGGDPGVYTLEAVNDLGYEAQLCLTVRMPWSWYLHKAAQAVLDAPPKATSHAESWYGFYTAYLARKHMPEPERDRAVDRKMAELYPLLYDAATGRPLHQKDRIQNHSSMLGICVDVFQSTGSREALDQAEKLADLILTTQGLDGGFYKGQTDYTSVIYPAKSLMELVELERDLAADSRFSEGERQFFRERRDLHLAALTRAMDHLAALDGNFSTEGATASCYEDGANSCSATQLSQFARMFPAGSEQRAYYGGAAKSILDRHASHEQILIPDSRMVGGTLRYWEAQYDVELGGTAQVPRGQMMDSPHGWSAWSIYALFHVYDLTGDVKYLRRGVNAMGACAQLMSFSGQLRWAFVPDPQRHVRLFVPDPDNTTGDRIAGTHVDTVIGEQYIPMISTWWRAPPHTWVPGYRAMGGRELQGASCDNDVHEVFKAMEETVLTKAYAAELENGQWLVCNAAVRPEDAHVEITPTEDLVTAVSVLVRRERQVSVVFAQGACTEICRPGKPCWLFRPS